MMSKLEIGLLIVGILITILFIVLSVVYKDNIPIFSISTMLAGAIGITTIGYLIFVTVAPKVIKTAENEGISIANQIPFPKENNL